MEIKIEKNYLFGVGNINDIMCENVETSECIDDLVISSETEGGIILPKIIGVYQQDNRFPEERKRYFSELDRKKIFDLTGMVEEIHPDLISIAYDPTIFPNGLLKEFLDGDVLNRLKVTRYLDMPNFYDKNVPEPTMTIHKMNYQRSSGDVSVLEREKNVLEMSREDFGLTRYEAVELLCSEYALKEVSRSSTIITDIPSLIRLPMPRMIIKEEDKK